MILKYYKKSLTNRKYLYVILSSLYLTCCNIEENKFLSIEEKTDLAVKLVDSILLNNYADQNMPIFLHNQDIHFIEKFHDSLIELAMTDLLYYRNNKDSLIDMYGTDIINSNITYIEENIKFYKTFCGFEIKKHFNVAEEKTPRAMQLFFVDTSLVLRAVSKGWFTKMYIDTIDGKVKRYYVDTAEYYYYENFWND